MDANNYLCCRCGSSAQWFCVCTVPEAFLCRICLDKHSAEPDLTHSIQPIDQFANYKTPYYHKVRVENFPRVREETRNSVRQVDRAIEEFTHQVNSVIAELTTYAKQVVKELNELKRKLQVETETALEEVERTLGQDKPQLTSRYGPLLRQLTQSPGPVQLFTFQLSSPPGPSSFLSLSTHLPPLDTSNEFQVNQLQHFYSQELRFFNFQANAWEPHGNLMQNIQADDSSTWVVLEEKSVFCCGGGEV